ncbi:hypothetical protein ABB37_00370 [Leptomonas pyrrhocoris]|uniref:Uncharacterized protein n=1 Tax=Leptomonas pyrrhocoris TaxID=157538 RepID=A0A0M9GA71_LEPPY|nr:hypothetical protein ABB37_00370 [Leptomonas pyrrhocoris]KPA86110.1 hypothetical protein ABB37_00370 [Leptomonas pyrrhocoris]|eukprot:XP_015664549.1 hypothetical protein ABB37_00370 [Leptomonas pyrrhocoris]
MLLDDEVIAQQFETLFRVAEALKQLTIAPQRPKLSSYQCFDESSFTSAHPSFLARAAREASNDSTASRKEDSIAFPPNLSFSKKSPQQTSLFDRTSLSNIDQQVQLPRVLTDSDLHPLRRIGHLLEAVATQLQASVDAKLVDFYTHLSKKSNAGSIGGVRTPANPTNASLTAPAWRKAAAAESKTRTDPLAEAAPPAATSLLHGSSAPLSTAATPAVHLPSATKARGFGAPLADTNANEGSPARPRAAFVFDAPDELAYPIAPPAFSNGGNNDNGSILEQSRQDDSINTAITFPSTGASSRPFSPNQPKGTGSRPPNSYALSHNAPMARRVEEERAAAAELQSFFCLLLEAALHQTDATAAAVYLDDAALRPNSSNGEQSILCRASNSGAPRTASRSTAASNAGGGSGAAAAAAAATAGRAQFLHCVAHVRGHFPRTISCAMTNVLTTVAQTGIAVNLNYSESAAVLRPSDFSASSPDGSNAADKGGATFRGAASPHMQSNTAAAGAAAATNNPSLYLNMYNGVVVPIKDVGCLVLANKAKKSSSGAGGVPPHFSVFDEHVAWSSALIGEAVLQQYDRELLLRSTSWAPSCATTLRPFTHTKTTPAAQQQQSSLSATADLPRRRRHNSSSSTERRRAEGRVGSRRGVAANKTVRILSDSDSLFETLQKDEAASLVFSAQNDIYAKRLTIVRTEDRQLGKALPPELRASSPKTMTLPATQKIVAAVVRSGRAAGSLAGTSGQLNDEDLFMAAAQYITNMESLWRKTIADSNTMHTVVENYDKEIQQRGDKIVHLESRIRELNAYVVQLERRNNTARLFNTTTPHY